MQKNNFLALLFISTINLTINPQIHVFGDSHVNAFCDIFGVTIHHLGPHTMHRISTQPEWFKALTTEHGLQNQDIALFVFGEIDARYHIIKQHYKYNRNLDAIITTLVINYVSTIIQIRNQCETLPCIVCTVIPPANFCSSAKKLPIEGSIEERIYVTNLLNQTLAKACLNNNIYLFDPMHHYTSSSGSLEYAKSDGRNHIALECRGYLANEFSTITNIIKQKYGVNKLSCLKHHTIHCEFLPHKLHDYRLPSNRKKNKRQT